MNSKYLVMAGQVPSIMCEEHAKIFEKMMMVAELPHTIIEMDDEDAIDAVCQVCELKETMDEINRPKLILPGEF
jgi:hypothetical protein